MDRGAGILCHISSLPGKYGIGNLGKEAYRFADRLIKSGIKYWQILPLVQTGFGDSPYQSVSCTSGNPYFIDPEALYAQKLLTKSELLSAMRKGKIDYASLYEERYQTLRKAFSRFHFEGEEFRDFIASGRAENYALFMTAREVYGSPFSKWDKPLKDRDLDALAALKKDHHEEYLFWQFLQYEFWREWKELKSYCNRAGLKIIGDLPLYVAADSADVWADPELFCLDEEKRPAKVAGVPPDYFSPTGQLWGNPVYDWEAHKREHFRWWKARLKSALEAYDLVRIDHFRGLDRYYEISADAQTAESGEWREGPKEEALDGIGRGALIAEDLGVIDDGVTALLKKTGLPGMKVLLFAFDGDPKNPFLPQNMGAHSVCYTGTHDNDTVAGYVKSLSSEDFILFRSRVAAALKECGLKSILTQDPGSFSQAFCEMALYSKADLAILSVQDLMGLDNSARMNCPGVATGNWEFRLNRQPSANAFCRLKKMIKIYRR